MQCLWIGCEVCTIVSFDEISVTTADRDSHLYDTHGNGTGAVRILEQEASEISFPLAAFETGTGILNPGRVLDRVDHCQRHSSSYPYGPQLLCLLL